MRVALNIVDQLKTERTMKNSLLIGLLFILLVSCKKDPVETASIDGTWVETTQRMDTLVFDHQHPFFDLNRGKELRDGHLLPKYLSGPYLYEIGKDNIYLRWGLSSSSSGTNYYFNADSKNGQMSIGNFFVDSISKNEVLTFSRIP